MLSKELVYTILYLIVLTILHPMTEGFDITI